jgi:flagellar biosynthesis protein FlhF
MLVKTFQAASMPEALRMVKAELGPDAMILSTKKENTGGILGFFSKSVYRVTAAIDPSPRQAPSPAPAYGTNRSRPERERTAKEELESSMFAPLARELKELREKVDALSRREDDAKKPAREENQEDAAPLGFNLKNVPRGDLEEIKKLLLNTLAKSQEGGARTVQWPNVSETSSAEAASGLELLPEDSPLAQELIQAGISTDLIRRILDTLSALPADDGVQNLKSRLGTTFSKLIKFAGTLKMRKNSPRIIALVGPTGVGKTTTTAKIAARAVVRHGTERIALLTTDCYRIGGHEQLRIFGRILGIAVHAVRDASDLDLMLADLKHKHLVLIDTVGMSQRDQQVAGQLAMLSGTVRRLLLLNASTNGETLDDVVRAYRGSGLDGCIITKTDEAARIGAVLDVAIRHRLAVHYVSNGQRVPEDLHATDRKYLLHKALRSAAGATAYALADDELDAVALGAQQRPGAAMSFASAHAG